MDVFDSRDQLHKHDAGFPDKYHFKQWYKIVNFLL